MLLGKSYIFLCELFWSWYARLHGGPPLMCGRESMLLDAGKDH